MSRSEAIRAALIQAADRLQNRKVLAEEVAALEADEPTVLRCSPSQSVMEQLRAAG